MHAQPLMPPESGSRAVTDTPSIRSILLQRGFTLRGQHAAYFPFEMAQLILQHLSFYNVLRLQLLNKDSGKSASTQLSAPVLLRALERQQWIRRRHDGRIELADISQEASRYLRGTWLEEYVWHALKLSGADEVMIGQKIFWHVDGVDGENEIDVIARNGTTLTFISCKTRGPSDTSGATDDLSKQMYEVAYWKQHFLGPDDKALLATTLDMIDERQDDRERVPMVRARGAVLGVEVWGYEDLLAKAGQIYQQ